MDVLKQEKGNVFVYDYSVSDADTDDSGKITMTLTSKTTANVEIKGVYSESGESMDYDYKCSVEKE